MVNGGVILMIATRLDTTTNMEIQKNGLHALKESLGVTGMLRFLVQPHS